MNKHFLFISKSNFDHEKLDKIIKNYCKNSTISYFDELSGDILTDSLNYEILDSNIHNISVGLNTTFSIMASHDDSEFCKTLLKEAIAYFPNQVSFPSDLIMKEMSFGDYRSYSSIKNLFSSIDREILETVGTYLRCGLDGLSASRRLNIHRNTFNYRINKFIEQTNLDIRDYHNALLLELYFQLIS